MLRSVSVNCTVYFLGGSCTYTLSRRSHRRPHTSLLKQRLTWDSVKIVTLSSGGKLLPTDALPKISAFLLTSASKHVSGDEEKEQTLGACFLGARGRGWVTERGYERPPWARPALGCGSPLCKRHWRKWQEETAMGNVGQAGAQGMISLVPARWQRATSRFSAPFTYACLQLITTKNMMIFAICHLRNCNKSSQFFPLPVQERWDEKEWLCASIQVEERKQNAGRWQWGEIPFTWQSLFLKCWITKERTIHLSGWTHHKPLIAPTYADASKPQSHPQGMHLKATFTFALVYPHTLGRRGHYVLVPCPGEWEREAVWAPWNPQTHGSVCSGTCSALHTTSGWVRNDQST